MLNGRVVFRCVSFSVQHSAFSVVFVPLMMVGDDQINAPVLGDLGLLDGGDAAIDGDDELRAGIANLLQRLVVQPVPLVNAVRDVEVNVAAQHGDGVPEDGGGGDAVYVVVAIDDDPLLVAHRLGHPLGGFAQVRDRKRIVQALEAGAEEVLAVGRVGDTS